MPVRWNFWKAHLKKIVPPVSIFWPRTKSKLSDRLPEMLRDECKTMAV